MHNKTINYSVLRSCSQCMHLSAFPNTFLPSSLAIIASYHTPIICDVIATNTFTTTPKQPLSHPPRPTHQVVRTARVFASFITSSQSSLPTPYV